MIRIFYVLFIGIICPGYFVLDGGFASREVAYRAVCSNQLKQIGLALQNYHDTHKHFPPANVCDKDGNPLFSWQVELMPELDHESGYGKLNKDEPWDSPQNARVLSKLEIYQFVCPKAKKSEKNHSSNYIAIIGPGTIWRKEEPVSKKDLKTAPSLTVAAIECVNSDKHWAEPYTLTVEEALERMKTGEGMRISTAHPHMINVLFADGHVQSLSVDMPISVWRKLLMGEVTSANELDRGGSDDPDDPSPVNLSVYKSPPKPGEGAFALSIVVWLISLALLFYRAWDSRPRAEEQATIAE